VRILEVVMRVKKFYRERGHKVKKQAEDAGKPRLPPRAEDARVNDRRRR
jgi:hypothetical protein